MTCTNSNAQQNSLGPPPRRRLVVLASVLTTLMLVTSSMQFGLGALGPHIKDEFHLSNSTLGLLNLSYYAMVAGFSIVVPRLLRHLTDRRAAGGMLVLTACGLMVVAGSPSVWVILVGLCLASISTAGANPVTNRAALAAGEARTSLIAVKQSGVALSTVLCGATLPVLASAVGWRHGLAIFSGVCLLPLLVLRSVSPSPASANSAAGLSSFRYSTRQLVVYAFLMGCGSSTVTAYVVLFGVHNLELTEARAGMLLSSVGLGSMLGRVVWGSLAVRSTRRRRHLQGHLTSMAFLACVSAVGLAASERVGVSLAVPCAMLMGLSASSWNPLGMMIVTASGDSGRTMTMSGQVMFGFFSGLAVAPPLFGAIIDASGYASAWLATSAVFAIATLTIVRRSRSLSVR